MLYEGIEQLNYVLWHSHFPDLFTDNVDSYKQCNMGHWQCCWVYQCPKNLHHSYQLMIGWSRRRKEFKQYQETAQWEHLEIANITVMTLTLITIFIATQNHKQMCLYDFFAWSSVYSAYKMRGSCNLLFQTRGSWLTYNKLQMLFSDMSCWITVNVHANAKLVKPATMTIHIMLHPHTANHLSQVKDKMAYLWIVLLYEEKSFVKKAVKILPMQSATDCKQLAICCSTFKIPMTLSITTSKNISIFKFAKSRKDSKESVLSCWVMMWSTTPTTALNKHHIRSIC